VGLISIRCWLRVLPGNRPNNIGLLVTVWGEVTQRDTTACSIFYIDDGSIIRDGTQTGGVDNVGIRVKASPTGHNTGDYVAVTGISCFTTGARKADPSESGRHPDAQSVGGPSQRPEPAA